MRRIKSLFTLVVLINLTSLEALAYDIAVENGEGVTIYYNYINDGSELEVTYKSGSGSSNNHPRTSGYEDLEEVTIPSIVNYSGKTYKLQVLVPMLSIVFLEWAEQQNVISS